MTGKNERRHNIEGMQTSMKDFGKHITHGVHATTQAVGRAIAAVVAYGTAGFDLVKAAAHLIAWIGSGIHGAVTDLMHEHSTMTQEVPEKD